MNNKVINVEVFFTDDGSLQVSYPQLNKYIVWSFYARKDNENINKFFNDLAKQKILRCYEKENNRILYIQNDKNAGYKVILKDYNRLLNIIRCDKINRKMDQYWLKKAVTGIQKKLSIKFENLMKKTPTPFVIAGSLLTASIVIPTVIASNNIKTDINNSSSINITEEASTSENTNEVSEIIINEENLNSSNSISQPTNIEIEELVIDENDIATIDVDNHNQNINIQNNSTINFSELASFTSHMEYINFASTLYGVDIETSKELLKDKVGNMENYINNSNNSELKNLYELKNIGVINGDLDVMGIFIIIKNYAIDNLNLDNQEPIISNKTDSEKEKDMIDIARYVYGIDDTNILNTIIATHRVETGYGSSAYALKLNNLGGNMNANPSQEQINRFIRIIKPEEINIEKNPIPNIYKTVEIGAESMVRNFLNVYSKCLHDEECLSKNNIVDFLSKKYCTHTPEAWAQVINEMLDEGTIQEKVESYIDSNGKNL